MIVFSTGSEYRRSVEWFHCSRNDRELLHDRRHMSALHVAIEGLDRRSLTALGTRHRIVVVGHRENSRTGKITIDAYIEPRQEVWLRKRGYSVTRLEAVDAPARRRQKDGRRDAARRLAKGRYGDVIWGGGYLT